MARFPMFFRPMWVPALLATSAVTFGHAGDLFVGHNGANQLVVEFNFSETLPVGFVDGLLHGCALDEPGFASLDVDEPDEDFFMLGANANIVFEVVSVTAGFKAHTPGLVDTLDSIGDQWQIGSPAFDTHLEWHIDSNDPGFNPAAVYSMSFKLIDTGSTAYSESQVYTVNFQCALTGACCVDGVCQEQFADPCGDEGGTYFGDDTVCLESADGDNIDDLCDNCPAAANNSQVDSDGDGTGDACDDCPTDPAKISPGACGCGASDVDSDGDTVADCNDICSGQDDLVDADHNGTPDCHQFQAIPTVSEWGVAILALAFLALAKVYFGASRKTAA